MSRRLALLGCALVTACGVDFPVDVESLPDRTREVGAVAMVDAAGGLRDRRGISATINGGIAEFYFLEPGEHGLAYADASFKDNRHFWSPEGDIGDVTATLHDAAGIDRVYWATSSSRGRGVWSVWGGNQPRELVRTIDGESARMAVSPHGTAVAALMATGSPTLHVRAGAWSWDRSGSMVPLWVADNGATVLVATSDSALAFVHAPASAFVPATVEPVTPPARTRPVRVVASFDRVSVLLAEPRGGDTTGFSAWDPIRGSRIELGWVVGSWRAPSLDSQATRAVVWTTRDGGAHWSLVLLDLGPGTTLLERAGDLQQMRPWDCLFANGFVAWSWGDGRLRVTSIPGHV